MAKKRFTDNLLDLFGTVNQTPTSAQSTPSASPTQEETQANAKRTAQKDFTASLQSFLAEAFEDSFENQLSLPDGAPVKARPKRPRNSLDMLIRDTLEPTSIELQDQPSRRVTLAFDPSKLEKLRAIARLEKAMLKDIIDEIVAEFIRDYENQKGKLRGN